jgi:lipoprotein-anchoring transpeptidase ErfK/SrfK
VFFHGGYAIPGTTEVRRLGRPASHGCIRLHPDNAKVFYTLVLKNGRENTTITITR